MLPAASTLHHHSSPLQLIRKKLKQCYKESGVNYQQNCRELAQVCRAAECCSRGAAVVQQGRQARLDDKQLGLSATRLTRSAA